MQRLYCDFLGPYPGSKARNTSLFIAIDHFSFFLFLQPMKCATTANVIEFFQNYILNSFGVPQYIHSDNGNQFVSKDMEEFLSDYGIKHIKTGLYSPQANSADYHTSIDCSPYYAMFGQNMCSHGSSYDLLSRLDLMSDDTRINRVDKLSNLQSGRN